MTERARILAWWGYVLCVVAIYAVVFRAAGFAYAVLAALLGIAVLGTILKLAVARLARRGPDRVAPPQRPRHDDAPR